MILDLRNRKLFCLLALFVNLRFGSGETPFPVKFDIALIYLSKLILGKKT